MGGGRLRGFYIGMKGISVGLFLRHGGFGSWICDCMCHGLSSTEVVDAPGVFLSLKGAAVFGSPLGSRSRRRSAHLTALALEMLCFGRPAFPRTLPEGLCSLGERIPTWSPGLRTAMIHMS